MYIKASDCGFFFLECVGNEIYFFGFRKISNNFYYFFQTRTSYSTRYNYKINRNSTSHRNLKKFFARSKRLKSEFKSDDSDYS